MSTPSSSPTRYRFWVLAVLCSLAFLTYLDRICIMRVQGDIESALAGIKIIIETIAPWKSPQVSPASPTSARPVRAGPAANIEAAPSRR